MGRDAREVAARHVNISAVLRHLGEVRSRRGNDQRARMLAKPVHIMLVLHLFYRGRARSEIIGPRWIIVIRILLHGLVVHVYGLAVVGVSASCVRRHRAGIMP